MIIGKSNDKIYGRMQQWNKFLKTEDKDEKKKILTDIMNSRKSEDDTVLSPEVEKWKRIKEKVIQQNIASKIARGEYVKDSDRKELAEKNPKLLRKAKVANIQRKSLESRLKNCRSKREAQDMLYQARTVTINVISRDDKGVMTSLQLSGIDKAEENYKNKKLNKDENNSTNNDYQSEGKKQSEIENSN